MMKGVLCRGVAEFGLSMMKGVDYQTATAKVIQFIYLLSVSEVNDAIKSFCFVLHSMN